MADRGETAYNTHSLNIVFAISSLALLASLVWMLLADYGREWKDWQRKARQIDVQRVTSDIMAENQSGGAKSLEERIADMEREGREQEKRVEDSDKEYRELLKRLEKENGHVFSSEQEKKFMKAKEDAVRYEVEMKRQELKDPHWGEARMNDAIEKTQAALVAYQTALSVSKETESRIATKMAEANKTRSKLAAMRRELDRLKKRRDDLTSVVRQQVMNAPGLDFIAPTLQIRKVVLDGLNFELNFTKKKRIDMCMSCHTFIDTPGYEVHAIPRIEGESFADSIVGWTLARDVMSGKDTLAAKGTAITREIAAKIAAQKDVANVVVDLPQPLRTHPRLDYYLSAASPHPIDAVGCTVCHRGSGESVGFVTSDHSPELYHRELMEAAGLSEVEKFAKNEEATRKQSEEWHEKYHWHKQHHWDYPMLPASYTEASCLQCHKDSMEMIRDAAPTLYKGWKLVEEKACYSCHKIGGWRDNRRAGPALVNIAEKLQPEFAYAWIENPKNFRPTTRMPQIFHLENAVKVKPPAMATMDEVRMEVAAKATFAEKSNKEALDKKVRDEYERRTKAFEDAKKSYESVSSAYKAAHRDYETQVWDDVAIHGVVTFLFNRSQPKALPEPKTKGDASKGKDQFVLAGCLACHSMSEGDARIGKDNPYGHYGPDLTGIGSKVTEKWIYNWILNPHAWWAETRMPNLRLAEDEAANIAAWLSTQKKAGFAPSRPPVDATVLEREAMVYLTSKFPRTDSELRLQQIRDGNFDGTKNDPTPSIDRKLWPEQPLKGDQAVAFYLGERNISRQGCYSCHLIRGLEDGQAIGTELTEWGSKEVEKLDFGLLEHTWEIEQKFGKDKHPYMNVPGTPTAGRELANGLNHINRIQWLEQKLRAPRSFDRGRDKAPLDIWRMPWFNLTEEEIHAITTYVIGLTREGDVDALKKMQMTTERATMEKGWYTLRSRNCFGCHIFDSERIEYRKDGKTVNVAGLVTVDEPGDEEIAMQLWEPSPVLSDDPEESKVSAIVSIPRKDIMSRTPALGGGVMPSVVAWYQEKENKGLTETMPLLPPVLKDEGDKVRPAWAFGFLKEPYTIRPIVKIHMPNFRLSDDEAKAIAQFFPQRHARSYAKRLSLDLRQKEKMTAEKLAEEIKIDSGDKVRLIESGVWPANDVFARLLEFAKSKNGGTPAPPEVFEFVAEREQEYRDAREAEHNDYFDQAWNIMTNANAGNCFSCHYRGSQKPLGLPDSWAPDLVRVKERLRPDWVYRWLMDPQAISPGTKMPQPAIPPDILNSTTREKLSQAMKDVLMNWEFLHRLTEKPIAATQPK
jgi:cbb3-type cytochrome oxidase cytochrome c subunit